MKTNEAVFEWLMAYPPNTERREYPIEGESPILAMTDMIWSPPYGPDSSHSHNCMEIGLCVAGSGMIRMGRAAGRPFEKGTVVIIPEGVRHRQHNEGQPVTRWRYIAVDQTRLLQESTKRCREEIGRLIDKSAGGVYLYEHEMTEDIARLIQKMFEIKCEFADESTAELEAMLLLILTRVAREPGRGALQEEVDPLIVKPVEPALLYIAEHYGEEIKIGQLARICAMSESYFRKVFDKTMGMGPLEYVNRYRIARASTMLRESHTSVSHVAESCGFPSIATFNRNFLRYVGQNPTDWKREHGNQG